MNYIRHIALYFGITILSCGIGIIQCMFFNLCSPSTNLLLQALGIFAAVEFYLIDVRQRKIFIMTRRIIGRLDKVKK